MEKKLLAASIADRAIFNQLLSTNIEKELSDPIKIIYKEITNYYNTDSKAKSVDVDLVKQALERKYPKHFKALNMILESLGDVSGLNVLDTYIALRRNAIGMRLSSALLNQDDAKVEELIEDYGSLCSVHDISDADEDEVYIGASLRELGVEEEREFTLYPKSLQERTRGAGRGHHILVFARPEAGKSLVSINLACTMAKQGHTVLYIGNEDPPKDLLERMTSRLSGMNRTEALADMDASHKKAMDNGYDNIILKPMTPGTIPQIVKAVEKYKPDVLIVDQIRNIDVGLEGLVHILEKVATEIRNIAKKYQLLAVSVTQAGDSATNKLVLSMSDVDSSKTGLPAAIDLMIGVGNDPAFEGSNRRMFSLPKNKLGADHSYFPVAVDPTLSKVNSI